jgi:hypothetical protein
MAADEIDGVAFRAVHKRKSPMSGRALAHGATSAANQIRWL